MDIQNYYNMQFKNHFATTENLYADVAFDFRKIVEQLNNLQNKKALDLGYGFGNYSIYLAQNGYNVDAIDLVDKTWFEKRLDEFPGIKKRINVISRDICDFDYVKRYDIILCKDVIHYLSINKIKKILSQIKRIINKNGIVYIVTFTDIVRRNRYGELTKLDGEAELKKEEWEKMIYSIFNTFDIIINCEEYKEKEKYNSKYPNYFEAYKLTSTITNRKG